MRKYLTVFSVSWQNEFVYRLNFILWRLRNILRLLMTYFLWRGIFVSNQNVFGYSQSQMLTYVFMVLIVQSLIIASPSSDNIGGEIANGDLSNYLVKPVGYLKYWFTRDLSSKLLNLGFAAAETIVLWLFLRPQLYFPAGPAFLAGFIVSVVAGIGIYYLVNVTSRFIAFWMPENSWGLAFVVLVFLEILGGGIFPLDLLPKWVFILIQLTPFPYLVYFPIAIFAGKFSEWEMVRILVQAILWLVIMFWFTKFVWRKGLKVYQASGR